jgi:hypothetical protein
MRGAQEPNCSGAISGKRGLLDLIGSLVRPNSGMITVVRMAIG